MDAQKEIIITEDDTKLTIRTKVWNYFESNKLGSSPWPPHKRIPNYKTAKETADKARELDLFKSAKTIKMDPDKPLQFARYNALEDKKTLLVPVPRLSSYFMNKVEPFDDPKKNWSCSSKEGMVRFSKPIDMGEKEKVDLIVVGAVAVSPKGWRIGKGMGYSDLEYAMMSVLGYIDNDVKTVALVHDCQVVEGMPEGIFEQHDVPVDLIVTPTRVIECAGAAGRPREIFWNMLTKDQVESIPALGKLRYMEWKSGKAIQCLKDESECPTELEDVELRISQKMNRRDEERRPVKNTKRFSERVRNPGRRFVNGKRDGDERSFRGRRSFGYGRQSHLDHDGGGDAVLEVDNRNNSSRRPQRRFGNEGNNNNRERGSRSFDGQGDSWLYVGNIPWNIRVSEFKQQVKEVMQMQPLRVVWKGSYGFAFLSFSKESEAKEALNKLGGMKILNRELKVEIAQKRERKPFSNVNAAAGGETVGTKVEADADEASKALEKCIISEQTCQ